MGKQDIIKQKKSRRIYPSNPSLKQVPIKKLSKQEVIEEHQKKNTVCKNMGINSRISLSSQIWYLVDCLGFCFEVLGIEPIELHPFLLNFVTGSQ